MGHGCWNLQISTSNADAAKNLAKDLTKSLAVGLLQDGQHSYGRWIVTIAGVVLVVPGFRDPGNGIWPCRVPPRTATNLESGPPGNFRQIFQETSRKCPGRVREKSKNFDMSRMFPRKLLDKSGKRRGNFR